MPVYATFLLHQIQISANNANKKSIPLPRSQHGVGFERRLQLPSELHLVYVECNSRIHCNLVGASEMGEGGLDQLKNTLYHCGKAVLRGRCRLCRCRIVTAVSAFESHQIIPKRNRRALKSKSHSTLLYFLYFPPFLNNRNLLFTKIIISGSSSHHTLLNLPIFLILFNTAVTHFYFTSLQSFTPEISIPSLFWRVSHPLIDEPKHAIAHKRLSNYSRRLHNSSRENMKNKLFSNGIAVVSLIAAGLALTSAHGHQHGEVFGRVIQKSKASSGSSLTFTTPGLADGKVAVYDARSGVAVLISIPASVVVLPMPTGITRGSDCFGTKCDSTNAIHQSVSLTHPTPVPQLQPPAFEIQEGQLAGLPIRRMTRYRSSRTSDRDEVPPTTELDPTSTRTMLAKATGTYWLFVLRLRS